MYKFLFLAILASWCCLVCIEAQYTCYGTASPINTEVDTNNHSCVQTADSAFGITPTCNNRTGRFDTSTPTCTATTSCITVASVVSGFTGVHYGTGCVSATSITATVCLVGEPTSTETTTTTTTTVAAETTTAAATTTTTEAATTTTTAATTTTEGVTMDMGSSTMEAATTTSTAAGVARKKRAVDESTLTCVSTTLSGDALNCSLVGTVGLRQTRPATFLNFTEKGYDLSVAVLPVQCCTENNCNNLTGAAAVATQFVCKSGMSDNLTADTTNEKTCQGCWGLVSVNNGTTSVYRGCQEDLNQYAFPTSDFSTLTCATSPTCRYVGNDPTLEECFLCCASDECNSGYTEAVIRAGNVESGASPHIASTITFLLSSSLLFFLKY